MHASKAQKIWYSMKFFHVMGVYTLFMLNSIVLLVLKKNNKWKVLMRRVCHKNNNLKSKSINEII